MTICYRNNLRMFITHVYFVRMCEATAAVIRLPRARVDCLLRPDRYPARANSGEKEVQSAVLAEECFFQLL